MRLIYLALLSLLGFKTAPQVCCDDCGIQFFVFVFEYMCVQCTVNETSLMSYFTALVRIQAHLHCGSVGVAVIVVVSIMVFGSGCTVRGRGRNKA